MIDIKRLNIFIVSCYVVFFFFVLPLEYHDYATFGFVVLTATSFLFKRGWKTIKRKNLLYVFYFPMYFSVIFIASKFSVLNTAYSTIFILILLYVFYGSNYDFYLDQKNSDKKIDWIYFLILITITTQLIYQIYNGGINNDSISLYSSWDRNYSAVALFLFISYCDKRKHKLGILVGVIYAILMNSRGFLAMISLLYIVKLIRKLWVIKKTHKTEVSDLKKQKKVFILFIAMLIFSYAFSYFWVYNVSSNNVSAYHESINDNANAVRFRANINATDLLLKDKHLLFYGYDNDIASVLGISGEIDTNNRYLGYRLVQPHNSIINMLIKNGLIYSIFYMFLLSKLLSKFYNLNNMEYIVPYLFNSLIMHGMLITSHLVFWIFILSVPIKAISNKKFVI